MVLVARVLACIHSLKETRQSGTTGQSSSIPVSSRLIFHVLTVVLSFLFVSFFLQLFFLSSSFRTASIRKWCFSAYSCVHPFTQRSLTIRYHHGQSSSIRVYSRFNFHFFTVLLSFLLGSFFLPLFFPFSIFRTASIRKWCF